MLGHLVEDMLTSVAALELNTRMENEAKVTRMGPMRCSAVRRLLRAAPGLLAAGWSATTLGCRPPVYPDMASNDGGAIRLEEIQAITADANLSEADQRQALRALGIADEELIDLLIQNF